MKIKMKKRIKVFILFIIILFIATFALNENKVVVKKWYKHQILELKLQMIKQQFLDLQYKYGPEGAIDA